MLAVDQGQAHVIIVKIILVEAMGKRRADVSTATNNPKAKAKKGSVVPAPKDDFSVNATRYKEALDAWNFIIKSLAGHNFIDLCFFWFGPRYAL